MSRENTKADGIKCNSEPYRRAKIREVNSRSLSGGKQQQLGREGKFESDDVKGSFGSEPRDRKRKNADATRKTRVRENSAFSMKRKLSEAAVFRRRGSHVKREIIDEDDSYADEGSNDRASVLRGQSVKSNTSRGKKGGKKGDIEGGGASDDASRVKLRSKLINSLETSADNLRLKGKEIRRVTSADRHVVGSGDEVSEKYAGKKDKAGPIAEQKHQRYQTRVLDKSGKKIRISRKALADGTEETGRPLKKKKRVIKIDPYDISNKRLDDSVFINENVSEEKAEMSKNAQFRAIQPSPAILSFVEDNLLGRRRLIELQNAGYNVKLSAPVDNVPFSTSTERERIKENVFRNKLEFFAAAKVSSSFPPPMIPEIAFAGRSNVGKSSLLNALTRQWGVVRTSDKPGLTQTINFFRLASKLCLVDLPGYGFAYAKEEVKDAWEELVKEYVSTRIGLQQVCVLIDTKWGMKQRDHELIDLMERSQTPYQIVLTKTDVVFPIDVARRAMQIQETFKTNKSVINPVMMVSSKSGAGIGNLRTVLAKLARFVKP
ncbi:hypothetical protein OPV22_034008 [Ensete ventricosum]|uniref:EngB-type G domain-containing protein n=1 Tax=Ensete ventricosum TaxID=4639 RepID=A0AAV8Q119_ENSVE|nr:hypothetical protein OPV22_034008 [Ensete ventricosum]